MKKEITQPHPDTYRAWSEDWTKSVTFVGTLINSPIWSQFKKHLTNTLGKNWGWELSINSDKISTDIHHYNQYPS